MASAAAAGIIVAAAFKTPTLYFLRSPPPNFSKPSPSKRPFSIKSLHISHNPISKSLTPTNFQTQITPNASEKLKILVAEFKSLPEPIDRVKRLIHYASLLPEFHDSGRVESNRVTGCTAQVWLEVAMDSDGVMRFRADSDSEISKGFCYCLIWLFDGASFEEVLEVKIDDLGDLNIGVRVSSRVNTWHNVLIGMQRRTKALIMERYGDPHHVFTSNKL